MKAGTPRKSAWSPGAPVVSCSLISPSPNRKPAVGAYRLGGQCLTALGGTYGGFALDPSTNPRILAPLAERPDPHRVAPGCFQAILYLSPASVFQRCRFLFCFPCNTVSLEFAVFLRKHSTPSYLFLDGPVLVSGKPSPGLSEF